MEFIIKLYYEQKRRTDMKNTAARLKQLMSERNLKQVDILNMSKPFQKSLDISMGKSTLSQYVSGKQSPDQPRLYLLAKTLDVSEPWLMGFDVDRNRNLEDTLEHSDVSSTKLIDIYNQLNSNRKSNVYNYAKNQLSKQKSAYASGVISENKNFVYIYGSVSAGTGEYIPQDDDKPEKVVVEGVVPDHDFAVRVNGDSMEPVFNNGQIIYVNKIDRVDVRNNQFIIAELNGEFYVKKLHIDKGEVSLISLNQKYSSIKIHDYDDFIVRGVVII